MSGLRFISVLLFLLVTGAALAVNPMTRYVVTINDRPMISLRDFAETFDADVDYHVDRDEICLTLYDTTVYLVPYRMTAWVNDRKVWLDMPVVIIDDVTYLPVKFLCDAFGFRYEWGRPTRDLCIVNRWTTEVVVFVIDIDWHHRRHVWRHDYDYRWYINYHHHKTDWARRDADPPYHHHDGGHPYNDWRPGDRPGGYKDAGGPGGYQDSHGDRPNHAKPRPDFDPRDDRRDQYVDIDKVPGRPQWQDANDPLNDRPKPYDSDQRPEWYRPNPGVHHGGYNPRPGQPGGYEPKIDRPGERDDGPFWRRDQRPEGNMPPIVLPPNFDWIGKDIEIKPYGGNSHGGYNPQNDRPQGYHHQDKEQRVDSQDNDRREKESKGQGESKEKDKDNGDKGGEKESKGHRRDK
ncbi:MAG: stalk domain-containing protein [Armatimonadota bacterium]